MAPLKGIKPKNFEYFLTFNRNRLGTHQTKEWKKMMSDRMKKIGNKPPIRYGPMNEDQKRKIGDANRIRNAGKDFSKNFKGTNIKYGKDNHFWKGGVTAENKNFIKAVKNLREYQEWRRKIFERDNYTCQICKKKGGELNADHYPKTFASIMKENNIKTILEAINCTDLKDINNGRTLCVDCHRKTPTWGTRLEIKVKNYGNSYRKLGPTRLRVE